MGDGKALQGGTSHNLGQHFATAYGIEYLDRDQQRAKPWSTSWGSSTRMIGALIMTHGDDAGLVLPPRVAPYQVVIVPIPPRKGDWNEAVLPKARELQAALRGGGRARPPRRPRHAAAGLQVRGLGDARACRCASSSGQRDIDNQQCVLVRRDTRQKETRAARRPAGPRGRPARPPCSATCSSARGVPGRKHPPRGHLRRVQAGDGGDPRLPRGRPGAATPTCEARIKQETKATVRVIPLDAPPAAGPCVRCGRPAPAEVYFAQAY